MNNEVKIKTAKNILKFSLVFNALIGLALGYILTMIGHNSSSPVDWFWGTIWGVLLALLFAFIPYVLLALFDKSGKISTLFFWFCLALYCLCAFPMGLMLGIFILIGKMALNEERALRHTNQARAL